MPALALNGLTIPVLLEGAAQAPEIGEDAAASVSGEMLRLRRFIKRKYTLKAGPLTLAQKQDLFGLVEGQHDHWSFDETGTDWQWSEGGIGLLSGTATAETAHPKFGTGYISIGTSSHPTFDTRLTGGWTVMGWRYSSGAWHHYALTSDADAYTDGVLSGSTVLGMAVVSGSVRLGQALATQEWDDLVVLRWVASAELVAAVYAAGVAFRGPEPWATGDLLEDASTGLLVTFDPPTTEYKPFTTQGTSELYGQNVALSMREK